MEQIEFPATSGPDVMAAGCLANVCTSLTVSPNTRPSHCCRCCSLPASFADSTGSGRDPSGTLMRHFSPHYGTLSSFGFQWVYHLHLNWMRPPARSNTGTKFFLEALDWRISVKVRRCRPEKEGLALTNQKPPVLYNKHLSCQFVINSCTYSAHFQFCVFDLQPLKSSHTQSESLNALLVCLFPHHFLPFFQNTLFFLTPHPASSV